MTASTNRNVARAPARGDARFHLKTIRSQLSAAQRALVLGDVHDARIAIIQAQSALLFIRADAISEPST